MDHRELVLVINEHCVLGSAEDNACRSCLLKSVGGACSLTTVHLSWLSLEEQEESEETENDIYIKHLQAILESIPLEKDLDSLLASWVDFSSFSYAVMQSLVI